MVFALLAACQLEDFSVDFSTPPKTAPDGETEVTTPAPLDEEGVWIEQECDLAAGDLSVTWIVDLVGPSTPPPEFTGFHFYAVDEMWREPTGQSIDPSGDGILYSWSGATDCIAWEWMVPLGDTGP